jgi:hypothetical protein
MITGVEPSAGDVGYLTENDAGNLHVWRWWRETLKLKLQSVAFVSFFVFVMLSLFIGIDFWIWNLRGGFWLGSGDVACGLCLNVAGVWPFSVCAWRAYELVWYLPFVVILLHRKVEMNDNWW